MPLSKLVNHYFRGKKLYPERHKTSHPQDPPAVVNQTLPNVFVKDNAKALSKMNPQSLNPKLVDKDASSKKKPDFMENSNAKFLKRMNPQNLYQRLADKDPTQQKKPDLIETNGIAESLVGVFSVDISGSDKTAKGPRLSLKEQRRPELRRGRRKSPSPVPDDMNAGLGQLKIGHAENIMNPSALYNKLRNV